MRVLRRSEKRRAVQLLKTVPSHDLFTQRNQNASTVIVSTACARVSFPTRPLHDICSTVHHGAQRKALRVRPLQARKTQEEATRRHRRARPGVVFQPTTPSQQLQHFHAPLPHPESGTAFSEHTTIPTRTAHCPSR